jgi:hypothetical protein
MLANISGTACYHFATQLGSMRQNQAGRGDAAAQIVPIIQYFVIQAGTEQYGGKRISSAVLPRTCKCLVVPQPSMPGPFRLVYLDVKGEQSLEQLGLAIKMMLAEPAARSLFAAVFE